MFEYIIDIPYVDDIGFLNQTLDNLLRLIDNTSNESASVIQGANWGNLIWEESPPIELNKGESIGVIKTIPGVSPFICINKENEKPIFNNLNDK